MLPWCQQDRPDIAVGKRNRPSRARYSGASLTRTPFGGQCDDFRIHLSVIALLIASWGTSAFRSLPPWESDNKAGYQAYKEGRYLEAENYFVAALGGLNNSTRRFAPHTALNNLAGLYVGQGKYSRSRAVVPTRAINSEEILWSGGHRTGLHAE